MVKRGGFRSHWLSAYAGSSPVPCIRGKKMIYGATNVNLKILIASLRKKSNFWGKVSDMLSVPARKRITVNLGSLNNYSDGETVVIPGKLVAGGQLQKKLTISCWRFSEAVLTKLKSSGSSIISLHDLSVKELEGSNLRLVS